MDILDSPVELASMASLILLLVLHSHRALLLSVAAVVDDDDFSSDFDFSAGIAEAASLDLDAVSRATLTHFRLWTAFSILDDDLGFWVKPRSTTWFSRFLLEEYDDDRWVQLFRFTKQSVFTLANLLAPSIRRQDTKYRLAILVLVRLACALFKLSHGASLLVCSEMFAVGRSTVSIILRQVVHSVNVALCSEIAWPIEERVSMTAGAFKSLCGLPGVLGAIDGTHFAISKPRFGSADYYYFKSGGFAMNCQAVVDSSKRFLDLYVGMPGSVNDSRMLRRSTLYQRGQMSALWHNRFTFEGFSPYLLRDAGYPLLPWLMAPHRMQRDLSVADELFNRKLSRGRAVVENAFALLKGTFWELQHKSELHVNFFPDIVTSCAIMHNVLLKQSHTEVERLLEVLRREGLQPLPEEVPVEVADAAAVPADQADVPQSQTKRRELGAYLSLQRVVPM